MRKVKRYETRDIEIIIDTEPALYPEKSKVGTKGEERRDRGVMEDIQKTSIKTLCGAG